MQARATPSTVSPLNPKPDEDEKYCLCRPSAIRVSDQIPAMQACFFHFLRTKRFFKLF